MDGFSLVATRPGFVVVAKNPGVDFHDHGETAGLCTLVRRGLGLDRVWPVHRLDKDTSGLLLLATNRDAAVNLARVFRERGLDKYYVALSDHAPRKKQGLVQGDMVRSRRGTWKLVRTMLHPARTRFLSWSIRPGLRLFALKLLTGRTHQLRVALKSLGAPVLGDRLYHQLVPDWPDRMYLHAHTLRFVLDGTPHVFRCPPEQGAFFQDQSVQAAMTALGCLEDLPWPGEPVRCRADWCP
ncbi:MAG: RNA pseudouridine synthase [Deltaproteobacteria bacterium]|nr:pseudouridine synthase [Desulfovibrionaceae bacterium]NCD25677.1 RNA pseudouridine synthase [Deltaproteobacteria bacterium]